MRRTTRARLNTPSPARLGRVEVVVAVGVLVLLFAAALRVLSSTPLPPADFAFNNGAEVSTLDPATISSIPEGRIVRALFEGLCVKDPRTLEPLPGMAESWEISADGRTYTFHLREGARWSNGDRVTADDFVYSWQRVLHPATAAEYAYLLWYVRGGRQYSLAPDEAEPLGLRALDEMTFEVVLEEPTPYFLDLVGFYPLYPVNRRNLEEAQARWPGEWRLRWLAPENLVTNGPYRIGFRRINDRIRLVKNHGYWDAEHVAFETIDAFAIDHLGTSLNLYLTGELDWIDRPVTDVIPHLVEREDFHVSPFLGTYFYRVNTGEPPFDDPRVRRALALAINREALVEKITKAGERAAYGFTTEALASGYPRVEMEHSGDLATDLDEARRLLAEAGYGPGGREVPTFEILFNTDQVHRDIAEVIAHGWQHELGLSVKLLNQEWKVYLDSQKTLRYDVVRASWIGDYPDPNTFLDVFVTGGENNRTGWGNARYDELIERARRELDARERFSLLAEAESILLDELPILPIYHYVSRNLVNPRLGGFHENVRDEHFCKFWYWLDDEELREKRAELPAGTAIVPAPGPAGGLKAPADSAGEAR